VIATGGHPVRLPIPGADLGIISDDAFYLPKMPKRVAILGSGYIAVEFAGIFAALGAHVDLVYRAPLPLRGFDMDLRESLVEALGAQGVALHPGSRPIRIEADGDERVLTFGENQKLRTDLVFFATGRAPATRGLGLDSIGVATKDDGAVVVDQYLRSSVPHIYAIGDVTDRLNLTPVAIAEGHALADTLFGMNPRGVSLRNVPTAVFSTPPIATCGLTEEEAVEQGPMDVYVSKFTPMRHTLSGRVRKSMLKLVVDQATQKVVGAHMLGEDAPEIMQGLAIAMVMGATKADFDRTIGIHPTAAEEFVTLRTRTRVSGVAKAAE
jgi:glutathione reductase (NADPH)